MRAPSTVFRPAVAGAFAALFALMLTASLAFAKGEGAGIITLAAPIPRDAEPGSTLTVDFTATITDAAGTRTALRGSPFVLKLVGPDGATTEALASELGTAGSYRASIVVPASGITSAIFGLRGSAVMPDGTSSIQDIPFDVDGLLFTTTAHQAPAPAAASSPPPSSVEPAWPVVGLLGVLLGVAGLTLAVVGRRGLRSA
jgi:hypothetical protein